jgi:integrase/recombinase XerD
MNELLTDYLEYLKSLNYSNRTIEASNYIVLNFILYLKNREIDEAVKIRKTDLIEWQKYLSKQLNKKGLPIKARTINFKVTGVTGFLKYLSKKGYILESIPSTLQQVKEPQMLPLGVFTHNELKKIIAKVDTTNSMGYRDRTIIELLYSSAIRASELVGMNIDSVDFDNATAKIFGKGKKERVVPIGKTALKFLENYIKAVRPFMLNGNESKALFISRKRKRLAYAGLLKIIHRYADDTDIEENVTPHMFRRSCTTELIRNNANLYHVADLLGHSSLDTLKHYTKLTITDLKKTHRLCHPRDMDRQDIEQR